MKEPLETPLDNSLNESIIKRRKMKKTKSYRRSEKKEHPKTFEDKNSVLDTDNKKENSKKNKKEKEKRQHRNEPEREGVYKNNRKKMEKRRSKKGREREIF